MAKALVIVESPAKVKTINKILGRKYKVVSSMGHLIDLPKSTLGVDFEDNFKPRLVVIRNKQKMLTQLKKDAKNKTEIYIATDPDREGEAIGWNIVQQIGEGKEIFRVNFHEITKSAVLKAFEKPRKFDKKKIDAQIARRILDRIVGYQISPILWKKVGSRLSAGRVQSVALRIIVQREAEISKFIPQEYWRVAVDVAKKGDSGILTAELEKIDKEKFELKNEKDTTEIIEQIKQEDLYVSSISEREVKRNAQPPYITSTLQQDAFNKLNFNANKTMMLAQQLYEGIELDAGDPVGLITYMRTDSVNIAKEAVETVRGFIKDTYGDKFLPETPNKYKSKKSAQEAHEAIRPSDVLRTPDEVRKYLDQDQLKLYELIWKRFVSCQIVPAISLQKKLEITGGRFQFGASGSTIIFDGFLVVQKDVKDDSGIADLAKFNEKDPLDCKEIKPTQHFTKPPPRYSEASLVRALEEAGIGRPSTYAAIISTLVYRNYVQRERGYFMASELGILICNLLVEYFSKVMDISFTAQMEESLDLIEEGDLDSVQLLKDFYAPFKEELDYAMANIEKTQALMDKKCPDCDRPMTIKWGRKGRFLSCSGFPKCKFAQPYLTGVKCPDEACDGELVERRSMRGAMFYGCSKYPDCRYVTKKLPEQDSEKKNQS